MVIVDKPKDYDKIIVTLWGGAIVQFQETRGADNRQTDYYRGIETYVKAEVVVWEADSSSGSKLELPIGEHNFPFSFQLPQNIPSSFRGGVGKIKYKVEARIVQSGLINAVVKSKHTMKAHLKVVNRTSKANYTSQPARARGTKRMSFLGLCLFGSISATVNIPQTCFSLGEVLPISVDINNNSSKEISVSSVLTRKYTCTGYNGSRRKQFITKDSIGRTSSAHLRPGAITTVEGRYLKIPTDAVLTMRNCSCISVEYFLKVVVSIPWSTNLHMEIPIIVVYGD